MLPHHIEDGETLDALMPDLLAAMGPEDLLLLTADHGQLVTPIARTIYLPKHRELRAHLVNRGGAAVSSVDCVSP